MKNGALPKNSDYETMSLEIHVELLGYLNKLGKRVFEKHPERHTSVEDAFTSITNDIIHMGFKQLTCEAKQAIGLDLDD